MTLSYGCNSNHPEEFHELRMISSSGWILPEQKMWKLIHKREMLDSFKKSKNYKLLSYSQKEKIVLQRAEIIKELRGFDYKCINCGTSHNLTTYAVHGFEIFAWCCDKPNCVDYWNKIIIPTIKY